MTTKIEATPQHPVIIIREARTPGAWGKGATPAEAAKAIRKHGARNGCTVYVCAVDATGHIDEMGDMQRQTRGPIYRGFLHNTGVSSLTLYRDAASE